MHKIEQKYILLGHVFLWQVLHTYIKRQANEVDRHIERAGFSTQSLTKVV